MLATLLLHGQGHTRHPDRHSKKKPIARPHHLKHSLWSLLTHPDPGHRLIRRQNDLQICPRLACFSLWSSFPRFRPMAQISPCGAGFTVASNFIFFFADLRDLFQSFAYVYLMSIKYRDGDPGSGDREIGSSISRNLKGRIKGQTKLPGQRFP